MGEETVSGASPGQSRAEAAIETQLAVLVRNAELLRRRDPERDPLSRSAYLMLRAIDTAGPADINGLAAMLGLDASTAGRQVGALLDAALVTHDPDDADRRRTVVAMTARGRREMTRSKDQRQKRIRALTEDWSPGEARAFGELLTRYNQAVAAQYLPGPDAVTPR